MHYKAKGGITLINKNNYVTNAINLLNTIALVITIEKCSKLKGDIEYLKSKKKALIVD